MDIKKADSKGRVSGFEPNTHYVVDRSNGRFRKFTLDSVESVSPPSGEELQPLFPFPGTNASLAGMSWVITEERDGSLTVTPAYEV